MRSKSYLLKIFRIYSSKTEEEFFPLIDEYIVSGRRRRTIFKSIILIAIFSAAFGVLVGIVKMTLDLGRSEFINGISGGIIGAFSAATFFSIQRNDIKKFILDSNNRGHKIKEARHEKE